MASFGGQQNKDDLSTEGNSKPGLRQPKEETMSRLLNSRGDVRPFVLSANAPEFVPRGCSGYIPPVLSASAPEFVPRQAPDVVQQQEFGQVLGEFQQTIDILNMHPGNVEEYMRPLCAKFRNGVTSEEQMAAIIDILFQQSVNDANFRYTGARICQHINANLKDHKIFSKFREAFLKRSQKEYERREMLVTNPDSIDLLTGFTLFMGEIFLNLTIIRNDGRQLRMGILPSILKDLVLTLLSQPSKVTVKCTCQLLKLVGSGMEDMMRTDDGSPNSFDEVFSQLQLAMQSNSLDDNSKFLIESVIKLRQTNWGRPESTSSSSHDESSEFNGSLPLELVQNEPVFYNEQGKTISREEAGFYNEEIDEGEYILNDDEERAFLEWQAEAEMAPSDGLNNDAYGNWSHTDDHGVIRPGYCGGSGGNDDEMDDETEAAYEEFLRQSQMNQRSHHH